MCVCVCDVAEVLLCGASDMRLFSMSVHISSPSLLSTHVSYCTFSYVEPQRDDDSWVLCRSPDILVVFFFCIFVLTRLGLNCKAQR